VWLIIQPTVDSTYVECVISITLSPGSPIRFSLSAH
jgi:hypothetical protein